MSHILQINSSLHGDRGQSSILADRVVDRLQQAESGVTVTRRDLALEPVPHLDAATFSAFATPADERSPAQRARVARSDALIRELRRASTLVLAAPMYNFGLPSPLKAWFDHVARAGETFRYTESGPQGLLAGRDAIVVSARGGRYRGTEKDSQSRHLATLLEFLGFGPVHFVYAEGLAMGEDARRNALDEAREQTERLVA